MDGTPLELTMFLAATFAAALVAGLAGFAFGLVAAAIWLHILTPLQTASLIIAFGLIVQGVSVWKLRRALDWSRLWPFLLGGAVGVPVGVAALDWANPAYIRAGVGVVLVLYSIYGLARPTLKPFNGGTSADAGVGFLNGVLGGATGLAGILHDNLVRVARLDQGSAARGLSTGRSRSLRHERGVDWSQGRDLSRYGQAVLARFSGLAGRHLARTETLWPSR